MSVTPSLSPNETQLAAAPVMGRVSGRRLLHGGFLLWVLLVLCTTSWRDGIWTWGPVVAWPTAEAHRAAIGILSAFPLCFGVSWALWRWRGSTTPWQWGPTWLSAALALLSARLLLGLPLTPSWITLTQLLGVALLWLGYLFVINERPAWRGPLLVLIVVQSLIAIGQFLLQAPLGLSAFGEMSFTSSMEGASVVAARGSHWLRGYGLTPHPNYLGALLAVSLVLLLPSFATLRAGRRWLFTVGWLIGLLGLFVTFSRAALLGFAAGALWQLAAQWRVRPDRRAVAYVGFSLLIALLLLFPYRDLALSRITTLESPTEALSLNQRLQDLRLASQIFSEQPWGVNSPNYVDVAQERVAEAEVVHNALLLALAELGVVGGLAWLLLMGGGLGLIGAQRLFPPWLTVAVVTLFDVTFWPFGSARPALIFGIVAGLMVVESPTPTEENRLTLPRLACLALLLVAFAFPFEAVQPLLHLGTWLSFSTVEIVVYTALALWLVSLVGQRRWPAAPAALRAPLLLWLTVLLIAALAAPLERTMALKFWSRMVTGGLVLLMAFDLTQEARCWRRSVQMLALAALVVGLFGVAEALGWAALVAPFKAQAAQVGELVRISSTLDYPTVAAMLLEMTIPLLVVWLAQARGGLRIALAAGLLAALVTLVLTLSRAGLVGSVLALLLLMGVAWRRQGAADAQPLRWWSGVTLVLLLLLTMANFVSNPLTRMRLRSETEQAWYQVEYRAAPLPTMQPNERRRVPVQLRNVSVRGWDTGRTTPFALAYHLYDEAGTLVDYEGRRTFLDQAVPAGEVIELMALLQAPAKAGDYVVEWDMVQEGVAWFSWKEAATLRQPLTIVGESVDESAVSDVEAGSPPPLLRIPTPTRSTLWGAAVAMSRDYPLLGVGPGNFRLAYGRYSDMPLWDRNIHANNLYLEWLAGSGVVGLLAFLWLSWRIAAMGWRTLHMPGPAWPWQSAIVAGLAAWYLHGLLDYFYAFTPTYLAFFLLVALLASADDRNRM